MTVNEAHYSETKLLFTYGREKKEKGPEEKSLFSKQGL